MPAEITPIDQTAGACGSDGGISVSYGILCEDVTDITVVSGVVTGFTLASTKSFSKLVFDDDDTAFYNQEGEREGKKVTINQTAFMKFEQITSAKIIAGNNALQVCCSIWVHYLNSGVALVQGIDYFDDDSYLNAKTTAKITPSALSDTGENADRLEYNIESVGRRLSPTTSLTTTQIEALVGA